MLAQVTAAALASELKTLAHDFLTNAKLDTPPDPQTREHWLRRYHAGVERLQRAGIKTDASGQEQYIALRTQWDRYITLLAPKISFCATSSQSKALL